MSEAIRADPCAAPIHSSWRNGRGRYRVAFTGGKKSYSPPFIYVVVCPQSLSSWGPSGSLGVAAGSVGSLCAPFPCRHELFVRLSFPQPICLLGSCRYSIQFQLASRKGKDGCCEGGGENGRSGSRGHVTPKIRKNPEEAFLHSARPATRIHC